MFLMRRVAMVVRRGVVAVVVIVAVVVVVGGKGDICIVCLSIYLLVGLEQLSL